MKKERFVQFCLFYVGGGGIAWRSPASEVNLRAIDETVVHAQNLISVDCKICLYILALYLLHPCVRLSATVALGVARRIAVCAFRASLMGGAGEKKSCGFRGCALW